MVTELGGTPRLVDALVKARLWVLVEDGAQFSKWAEYQPLRADLEAARVKETERKRRWRERGNPASVPPGQDAGRDPESGHPDPTRPDPTRLTPKGVSATSKKKPELPLPVAWLPSDANEAFARDNNLDLDHELAQFKAHAAANDRRQRDWDAAFRMWLGNQVKWSKAAPKKRVPAGVPVSDEWRFH
jgi:hypothetical protein